MSQLGIFVDRETLSNSEQLNALIRCRDVAEGMGHDVDFIFPVDISKIPKVDALFIRARTDPHECYLCGGTDGKFLWDTGVLMIPVDPDLL